MLDNNKILKVIIETCLLTDDEKAKMCSLVAEGGADYIKTSTGFSNGGATFQDIALFSENIINKKIKSAPENFGCAAYYINRYLLHVL